MVSEGGMRLEGQKCKRDATEGVGVLLWSQEHQNNYCSLSTDTPAVQERAGVWSGCRATAMTAASRRGRLPAPVPTRLPAVAPLEVIQVLGRT
jgi:hypothetical protein